MTKARDNSKFGNFAGNEVFLDSDKDTSITADTDDQIDIKTGGTDRVHIDSSGNVGIGTNSPSQKLDVNGTINATAFTGDGSALTGVSAGKVLQVVQTIKTSTQIISNPTSYTDVSGLSVNITPSSTSNKILIIGTYMIMGDTNTQGYAAFYRNTTQIGVGDANGSRIRASTQSFPNQVNEGKNSSFCFLDSPSTTSQITYKLRARNQGTGNVYVNRSQTWGNSAQSSTNASTITVMEIEA